MNTTKDVYNDYSTISNPPNVNEDARKRAYEIKVIEDEIERVGIAAVLYEIILRAKSPR
jgi:hypothetical protein